MDKITKIIHKHFKKVSDDGVGFLNTNMELAIEDLDLLLNKWISVAINKIETGVNNKLVFESGNWHSYFKIGNQTFYLSESPTKKEAEWQEEQMKTAFNELIPKPPKK